MNHQPVSAAALLLISLALPQLAPAQATILFPINDSVHTAPGDILRGEGKLLEGRGAYLRGLGEYQTGAGRYLESLSRYQLGILQAQLAAEEVKQKKQETFHQKKSNEQARLQQKAQSKELARLHQQMQRLLALRDQPTTTAIQSGVAANFLIDQLGPKAGSANWRNVPLTAEQLAHVRLQTSTGLSRTELATQFDERGYVTWPSTMQAPEHEAARRSIEGRLRNLLGLVSSGRSVNPADVSAVRQEITKLMAQAQRQHNLAKNVAAATDVRLFMTNLSDTVKQLGHPAAVQLFDGTLDIQAQNASDLIEHLTRHNLRFAPTSANGVTVYARVHDVLATTHRQLGAVPVASR